MCWKAFPERLVSALFSCALFLSGCHSPGRPDHAAERGSDGNRAMELRHAEGFRVEARENDVVVKVLNPWNRGEVIREYFLSESGSRRNGKFIPVKTPVQRVITFSSTHLGMIYHLEAKDFLTGVSNTDFIYDVELLGRVAEGKIADVGDQAHPEREQLLSLRPDLIIVSGSETYHPAFAQLEEAGVPVLYNMEWKEKTPLGRFEWLRLLGLFFDRADHADSVFSHVESEYLRLKGVVASRQQRPEVLSGINYKGTWHMPGGQSYTARLFLDAGAKYYWAHDSTTGSIPLSSEDVFEKLADADVWVNPGLAVSLDNLAAMDDRNRLFRPFREGLVYNSIARMRDNQSNDYWETGLSNPHLILADLIHIFHPDILPRHRLVYYRKLP